MSVFLQACRRKKTPYTPIWLMRQAGRYMKEYRDLRDKYDFLTLCKDVSLSTQVTLDAVRRLDVDAAIIFSDILLILQPMGLGLRYTKGDGPVIDTPVRTAADVARLKPARAPEALAFVAQAIRATRRALRAETALIGFSGAPFTLASYMIEGGGSKQYLAAKSFFQHQPDAWNRLMRRLSDGLIDYLNMQIDAGADAVQLFDSWVGCLSAEDYRRFALPWTRRVIRRLRKKAVVIHFSTGTGSYLDRVAEAGGDVISVDWRVPLNQAWTQAGGPGRIAIQGNLDPVALFAPPSFIRREAKRILNEAGGQPGHIFNLGHGILPGTPVDHVLELVRFVKEQSRSLAPKRIGRRDRTAR